MAKQKVRAMAPKKQECQNGSGSEDRRITKSKKALRAALISLMEEKGFEALTVNDLCEQADLNRGTFYNHYQDKDDLLKSFEDEVIEGLVSTFHSEAKKLSARDLTLYKLHRKPFPVLIELFDYLREEGDFLHAVLGSGGDICFGPRVQEVVGDILITSILNEKYRKDPSAFVQYYLAYFTSAHLGLITRWVETGMVEDSEQMARITMRLFFIRPGESITL